MAASGGRKVEGAVGGSPMLAFQTLSFLERLTVEERRGWHTNFSPSFSGAAPA